MGADQQFCLRWNNFHTNITSAFESLRDDEDFVDITLACEGRQIKAHKMVLSACSPYFRTLLRVNPCQHPIVFLKDVTFANLSSILDFMYHGEVNVSHTELATFLKTAEALRVRGLAEDDKKRDGDVVPDAGSPTPRDPLEQASPGRADEPGGESRLPGESDLAPPAKRARHRSGSTAEHTTVSATATSTSSSITNSNSNINNSTNTGGGGSVGGSTSEIMQQLKSDSSVRDSVKNEPEDYTNDDEMLQQQQQQTQIATEDIKLDGFTAGSEDGNSSSAGGGTSAEYTLPGDVSITSSRNQAAMQQLQDTFSTFIPGISGNNSSFLQHSGDRSHASFGIEGLPAGISSLPGTSLAQTGSAAQDNSGQGGRSCHGSSPSFLWHHHTQQQSSSTTPVSTPQQQQQQCPHCLKMLSSRQSLLRHIDDRHVVNRPYRCIICGSMCKTKNALQKHHYTYHRGFPLRIIPANYT